MAYHNHSTSLQAAEQLIVTGLLTFAVKKLHPYLLWLFKLRIRPGIEPGTGLRNDVKNRAGNRVKE